MPTVPIPIVSAVLLVLFAIHLGVSNRRFGVVAAVIFACAVQSAIVALVQHYGVSALRPVQPVTATLVPVLAWIAYQATGRYGRLRALDLGHLFVPVAMAAIVIFLPPMIDLAVFAAFAAYGTAIFLAIRRGTDALPHTRLGAGSTPAKIWRIIAGILLFSAFSDLTIVAAQIAGLGAWQPLIITFSTAVGLLIMGWLLLSQEIEPASPEIPIAPMARPVDLDLMDRIDALMTEDRPYLDPELSLGRLARRLSVPVKDVSTAINAATGDNVSRFVNGYRVSAACTALLDGQSVTNAMLSAGFITKSNFNREFKRVTGQSPRDWLQSRP